MNDAVDLVNIINYSVIFNFCKTKFFVTDGDFDGRSFG